MSFVAFCSDYNDRFLKRNWTSINFSSFREFDYFREGVASMLQRSVTSSEKCSDRVNTTCFSLSNILIRHATNVKVCLSNLVHTCDVSEAIVNVRELRQSVNQYDVNRTQVSLPGGFRRCIEIFKMAGDGYESHVPVLLFILIKK